MLPHTLRRWWSHRPATPPRAYVLALAAVAAALAARLLLTPWLHGIAPFVTLLAAVAVAAWIGSSGTGLTAAAVGFVSCGFLLADPVDGHFGFGELGGGAGLAAFAGSSAVIVGLVETARGARQRETDRRELLRVALRSTGDAVATTDAGGAVTTMNAAAESLTGWTEAEAIGRPIDAVFRLGDERTWRPIENLAGRAIRDHACVPLPPDTALVGRTGYRCDVEGNATATRDAGGETSGCVLVLRDVTERRRRERDQASQLVTARMLAAIVESSEDAITTSSLDGTIRTWNRAAERLFGFPAVHAIGRHVSLVIPTERLAEDDSLVTCIAAGEHIDRLETDRLHADGRRIRVTITMSPLRDAAGRVVGVSRIIGDVSPRRSAERRERDRVAQAAATASRFQGFFEQAATFGAILDGLGTVLEVNRAASSGYGYARDQIVERAFWDGPWCAASSALSARVRRACLNASAGRTAREEVAFTAADGTTRRLHLTIVPILDDDGRVRFLAPLGVDAPAVTECEATG